MSTPLYRYIDMSGTTDEPRSVREFTVESPALLLLAGQERALAATHLRLRAASLRCYYVASALSSGRFRARHALRGCTRW